MSLLYRVLYGVGFTPWDRIHSQPAGQQATAYFAQAEAGRQPPYGKALDLGCGTGIWSVDLAKRGWDVTGIDIVPKAVRRARRRADEAGVDVRFLIGDVTRLEEAGVGAGFQLVLDFGTAHNLPAAKVAALGRQVTAATVPGAWLVMYAVAEGRGPGGTGLSRASIEAAYPEWRFENEEAVDVAGLPGPFAKADPRWYVLRRAA